MGVWTRHWTPLHAACIYGEYYRRLRLYAIIRPHAVRFPEYRQLTIELDGKTGKRVLGPDMVDVDQSVPIFILSGRRRRTCTVVGIPPLEAAHRV